MGKLFFLYLFLWMTRNPLLALAIAVILFLLIDRRYYGLVPDPLVTWRAGRHLAQLRRTVEINPNDSTAQNDIGRLLVDRGRHREAIPYLESALVRMADIPETNYYIGVAYLGTDDWRRSGPYLEKVLALDGSYKFQEPRLRLGDYFSRKGDYHRAIAEIDRYLAVRESSTEGLCRMGEVQLAAGNREKARGYLEKALTAFRNSPAYKRKSERRYARRARRILRTSKS